MNKNITAFLLAVLMMIILLPARVQAEVPMITVTLNPGDGSGTEESFTSADSGRMASDHNSAENGQFGVENDSLWLRLPDLPSSFTPPSDNMIFTGWKFGDEVLKQGKFLGNLTSDLTLTAQWGEAVNVKLLSLTPSSGTLDSEFDPDDDDGSYCLKVPYTGSPVSVTVEAVAQDPNASVKYGYEHGVLSDNCPEIKNEYGKSCVVIKVTNGVKEKSYTVELSLIYTLTLTTEGQGTAKAYFSNNNEGYTGGKENRLLLNAAPADGWKFKEWQLVSGGGSLSYATFKNGEYKFGEDNAVVKAVFEQLSTHTHDFTYTSSYDTIIARCSKEGCPLPPMGVGDIHTATLTIVKPTLTAYGQTGEGISSEATITDVNNIRGGAAVSYYKADDNGDKFGNALAAAPTDVGKYRAEITLGEGDGARTAYTVYTIAGAPVTIGTTDKSAVYSADGISVPVDSMFNIPDTAGTPTYTVTSGDNDTGEGSYDTDSGKLTVMKCGTFTVTVNTAKNGNYAAAEASATLTVKKADYVVTAPVAETSFGVTTLSYNGLPQKLVKAGSVEGNVGMMKYAVTTTDNPAPDAYFYSKSIPTATNVGSYYVWYKVEGDENYNDYVSGNAVSVEIAKADYTGTTTASAIVRSDSVTTNATLTLPALPEGASYDTVTVSGNSALISGTPTVDGTTLTFSTTAQNDQTSATITIRVTNATNYNDYDVVVTVTAKAKDEAGVVIAQGTTLNKAYGDADLTLNATVSKAGEGTGTWTWTSTAPDVLSVTGSGSSATAHILKPGTATVNAEYESDTTMGEASIQINIAMGEKPANAPAVLNVKYEVTAISSCGLPAGWVWNTRDPNYSKTIPEGGSLAVTADYSAADRIYYNTTRVSVTICRADGGKKDDTETIKDDIGNKAAPKGIWIANLESSYTYTGRNITPEVHVYAEDLLLTKGLDYTVSYKNNKNANDASVASKAPTVTVKLKGSYSGTKSATFRIAKLDLSTAIAQDIYKPVAKKAYGTIKPALYIDGTELKLAGSEAAYENPTGDYYSKPGTYDITVKAKTTAKNVTGTRKVKLHIVDAPTMEKVKAKASKSSYKYGDIKGITDPKEAVPVTVTYNNAVITEGFKVIYESGTSWKTLGTHYITVKGDGKTYYGEKKVSYKVTGKYSLDDDNAWIYIDGKKCDAGSDNISVSYNKTGIKPAVSIRYKPDFGSDQFVLTEKQDFTVSYRNNRNAGDTAEVTIKGKGIYSGKLTRKFTVSKVDLNDLILFVSDRAESKTKDDFKKTTKILYDKNLVDQKAPLKDFDIKYTDKDGKEISGTPAKGTLVNVTVTAKDTCKNFTGTKSTGFHIIDKTKDVGKMKVSFTYDKNAKGKSVGYYFFTGSEIRPKAVSQLHVKSGQTELKASDYSVRYFNNVNKGNKAAVLITGNDTAGYFGVKTAYFKIGNAAPQVFDKSSGTFK